MTINERWASQLKLAVYKVKYDRLKDFVDYISKQKDGGSWNMPYYDCNQTTIKDMNDHWLVITKIGDYPWVANRMKEEGFFL